MDAGGNLYDVEMQCASRGDELLRARRYQALMDVKQLKKSEEAKDLRNSIVVFICDFDPLQKPVKRNLKRYDCRLMCLQTGQAMPDGRQITFLNIKGRDGEVAPELDRLLKTFAGKEVDNDPFVDEIVAEVEKCSKDAAWMERLMTLEAEREAFMAQARADGCQEGFNSGRDEGFRDGRDEASRRIADENAALARALVTADRANELVEAMTDQTLRHKLLLELGIAHG